MERCAIVGSGASLRGVDLTFQDGVLVIAVNGALDLLARADVWFTLDPSPANEALMRSPRDGVEYVAAVPPSYGPRLPHVRYLERVTGDGHGRYKTKAGLSPDEMKVHTGNSAWGALQHAVHRGMRRIALFGIDGMGKYAYGGEPRNLSMMPELFASAFDELKTRGIEVVNGSPESAVTCFSRMPPSKAKEWIEQ